MSLSEINNNVCCCCVVTNYSFLFCNRGNSPLFNAFWGRLRHRTESWLMRDALRFVYDRNTRGLKRKSNFRIFCKGWGKKSHLKFWIFAEDEPKTDPLFWNPLVTALWDMKFFAHQSCSCVLNLCIDVPFTSGAKVVSFWCVSLKFHLYLGHCLWAGANWLTKSVSKDHIKYC